MLHVVLDYPTPEDELRILQQDRNRNSGNSEAIVNSPLTPDTVLTARQEVAEIHVEEILERYIVSLVTATRELEKWNPEWKSFLLAGASPRASIALLRASSALAYLHGRDYVTPEDIHDIAPDVLRHRLILDYACRVAKVSADDIIEHLLDVIPVP